MKKEYQKQLKRISQTIITHYKPERIILFGSFAYGEPNASSDIDLLIIKRTRKNRLERTKEILLLVDNQIPFEPIVLTPKEVKQRIKEGDYFIEDVLAKGTLVYEAKTQLPRVGRESR